MHVPCLSSRGVAVCNGVTEEELCQYMVDVFLLLNMTFRDVFCIFLAQKNGNVCIRLLYNNAEIYGRE